ncbi:MAG TPA: DUF1415 domain-containing protein [Methylophaga sp.]|nr:DUF1415 domain-containing protein [Methylophaga sp.]HEC58034.1 DUF1415 domain-containing protein [Methylophaga sp.]
MDDAILDVETWLDDVVIGLNLCPFAATPRKNKQVRFTVSQALTEEVLLADLYAELTLMSQTPAEEVETSLLIVPDMLNKFDDYNQFLDLADALLEEFEWDGIFQIASFHPDYCFAETDIDSIENLTNRSPYPILHILREATLEKALEKMTSPDEIFKRNIETMNELPDEKIKALFPYLHLSS